MRDELDLFEDWLYRQRRPERSHRRRTLLTTIAFGVTALLLSVGIFAAGLLPSEPAEAPATLTGLSLVTYDFVDGAGSNFSFFILNMDTTTHTYTIHYNVTLTGIEGFGFYAETFWRGTNWAFGNGSGVGGCPCKFAQVLDNYSLGADSSYVEFHTQKLWIDGGGSQAWYVAIALFGTNLREFSRENWNLDVWTVLV